MEPKDKKSAVIQGALYRRYEEFLTVIVHSERLVVQKTKFDALDLLTIPETFNRVMQELVTKYAASDWEREMFQHMLLIPGERVTFENTGNCFALVSMMASRFFMTEDPAMQMKGLPGFDDMKAKLDEGIKQLLTEIGDSVDHH